MLSGDIVATILANKGYKYLHHANTSATSLSFLKNNALLSRQYVAENSTISYQTVQNTDESDKKYGIYNSIFFDVENIWKIMELNYYGPVVFRYSLEVLRDKQIRITINNPKHWKVIPDGERYIDSTDAVEKLCMNSEPWSFGRHIVIPDTEKLSFDYLNDVLLYSPSRIYKGDSRNDPCAALTMIKSKCDSLHINYTEAQFDADYKAHIFYGFTSMVP